MTDVYSLTLPDIIESIDDYFNKYKKYIITTKRENEIEYNIKKIIQTNILSNNLYNDVYKRLLNNNKFISLITNIICTDTDSLFLGNYLANKLNVDLLLDNDFENIDNTKRILILCSSVNIETLNKYIESIENKNATVSGVFSIIGNNKITKCDLLYLIKFNKNEFTDTNIESSDSSLIKNNIPDDIKICNNDKITILPSQNMQLSAKKMCKINKNNY